MMNPFEGEKDHTFAISDETAKMDTAVITQSTHSPDYKSMHPSIHHLSN